MHMSDSATLLQQQDDCQASEHHGREIVGLRAHAQVAQLRAARALRRFFLRNRVFLVWYGCFVMEMTGVCA